MAGCPDYDNGCLCTRCQAGDDALSAPPVSEDFALELRSLIDGQLVRPPPCHGWANGCFCPRCKARNEHRRKQREAKKEAA